MAVLAPGLVGCSPDGPPEFYRGALQAKSEFVDSLGRVSDEKTAGEAKLVAKIYTARIKEISDQLEKARADESFNRLRRDNFDIKKIDADIRDRMIVGMREYANYCRNIVFTNARLRREVQRLQMVANLEMLAKARNQIAANQPVSVSMGDCPNLALLLKSAEPTQSNLLRFIPFNIGRVELDKLQSGLDPADLDLVIGFDPQNFRAQLNVLETPPLPRYPDWAIDVDNRAKLGLTGAR